MKMKQVRVSDAIPFFKDKIQGRFGLRPYDNPDKPAVFWGCDYTRWRNEDYRGPQDRLCFGLGRDRCASDAT